jgi:rhamnosyltransferase subunit B
MVNILLTNHWVDGDIQPLIRIGVALEKRGHHVTIFSHYGDEHLVREGKLSFVAWDAAPDAYYQIAAEKSQRTELACHHFQNWADFYQKYHGTEQCLAEYEKLRVCYQPGQTVILARHDAAFSPLLLGEKLHIPVVAVYLTPHDLERLKLMDELFGIQITEELNQVRRQLELSPIPGWLNWLRSFPGALGFWSPWFASPEADWPLAVRPAGFIFNEIATGLSIPSEVQTMLERGKPPILVWGESGNMAPPEFFAIAIQLADSAGLATIVVAADRSLLPRSLPENTQWAPRLPLTQVLPKVNLVIHPGGMETSIQALRVGIPQMILPHCAEGPDNAFRLMELGVAESFPPMLWKAHLLRISLVQLQGKSFRRRCREISRSLPNTDSCLEICRAVEAMVD